MRPNRFAWAFLILGLGLIAFVMLGTNVFGCLGPLGVTAIQCAKSSGIFPSVALGIPVLAGSLLLAAIVGLRGRLSPALRSAPVILIGAAATAAAYFALRPTVWTGPTSTGEVISLALPLDVGAVVSAAILGAAIGEVLASTIARFGVAGRRDTPEPA